MNATNWKQRHQVFGAIAHGLATYRVNLSFVGVFTNRVAGPARGVRAVGLICTGHVAAFYSMPMFEETGWGARLSPGDILFEKRWPETAEPTPTAY